MNIKYHQENKRRMGIADMVFGFGPGRLCSLEEVSFCLVFSEFLFLALSCKDGGGDGG